MPDARLQRTKGSLPDGYQFGDAAHSYRFREFWTYRDYQDAMLAADILAEADGS